MAAWCIWLKALGSAIWSEVPHALLQLLPFGENVGRIAERFWENLREAQPPTQDKVALEQLVNATPGDIKEQALVVAESLAREAAPEVRSRLAATLELAAPVSRRVLTRSEDLLGKSVPSAMRFDGPLVIGRFIPQGPPRFLEGMPFKGWVLRERLGVGGFAEVWRVCHPDDDSLEAAVKFFAGGEARRRWGEHEVAVLRQVRKLGTARGIVQLQDFDMRAEPPWIQFEYVSGGDLIRHARQFFGLQCLPLIRKLAETVGTLHRLNPPLVHRDLKPGNVLMRHEGGRLRPVIADFGIGGVSAAIELDQARMRQHSAALPTVLAGSHTALYASPQQVAREPPDPRDDVYALGVMWYQFAVGDLSTGAPTGLWAEELKDIGFSDELVRLLGACVEPRKVEKRPRDAQEVAERLAAAAGGPQGTQKTPPVAEPARKPKGNTAIGPTRPRPAGPARYRSPRASGGPPGYIGIDFGTTNCVVGRFLFGETQVVPNPEGQICTPSTVTMRRDGTLAFGQEARENFDERRSVRSIKRILGTPERLPFVGQNLRTEQIAVMLFSLLKRGIEQALDGPLSKAVITVPANSKGLARHATKLCAGAAGIQVLTLLNKPTAAAIRYGINAQDDQTVLVYDFGGGTLDVTILRVHHGMYEEVASKGIGKLGGDDIDMALANIVAERFQQKTGFDILNSPYKQQFMLAVERAKIELSDGDRAVARKAALVPERNLSLEEEVTRGEIERAIMPLVVKSGTAIDEALKLRGMRPRDIDKVLLVGGTSNIPLIRQFVSEKLGGKEPEPFDRVDPMTCVAEGAAIVSAILQGAAGLDSYAYSVKLEHSLCAPSIDARTGRIFLDPIIKRGSDIPCSYTKKYFPATDPADRVVIELYEGDIYDNPDSPENVKLAEIPWGFKPPRARRDGELEVTFEYGDDGILTVLIHDLHAGQKKRFAIQQSPITS